MTRIWYCRIIFWALTSVAILATWWVAIHQSNTLRDPAFLTGYLLAGSTLFLTLFNFRKKVLSLPLGSAALWLQLHIHVGMVTIAVFLIHTEFRLPTGKLESILYVAFTLTSLSGLWGWYLSLSAPMKLSKLRQEIIFERIPVLRAEVAQEAHQIVRSLASDPRADALPDLYARRLAQYFLNRRGWAYRLWPNSRLRNELRAELSALARYCPENQLGSHQELARLIDRKDDLDFHAAHQGWLKGWLFVHIGFTYVLIVLATLHSLLAHNFSGRSFYER
jgi:hypothetical protein